MSLINCPAGGETHNQGRTCARPLLAASAGSVMTEHERLKELCAVVEPFAAHYACDNRASDKMADDVYRACVEMRHIIYLPNAPLPNIKMSNKSIITEEITHSSDPRDERACRYDELIMAVARKFPGESRYETALRYIREAENKCLKHEPCTDGPKQPPA